MAEKFTAKQYAEMYGGHTITEEQTLFTQGLYYLVKNVMSLC